LEIKRDQKIIFEANITLNQMKRSLEELVSFVYRECSFPKGCLIMTGTGIVPGSDFTLHSNDEIKISIDPIGTLVNTVR
jgi:2-dehydro-3-deoxy-D-arabinonate dehydratase